MKLKVGGNKPSTDDKREEALKTELAATGEAPSEPKAKKPRKKRGRKTEDFFTKKYSHAIPGTLQWDPVANKQSMEIACQHPGCKNTRRVFTSDLFQIKLCIEHAKAERTAKRDAAKPAKVEETATA